MVLCTYAGLRGAIGLALALLVNSSPKVPDYVKDVILLHIGGVAFLTLIINAVTTGHLVKFLGLLKQSPIQKNLLRNSIAKLDEANETNIDTLR